MLYKQLLDLTAKTMAWCKPYVADIIPHRAAKQHYAALQQFGFSINYAARRIKLYRFSIDRFQTNHASRWEVASIACLSLSGVSQWILQPRRRTSRTHRVSTTRGMNMTPAAWASSPTSRAAKVTTLSKKGLRVLENLTHRGAVGADKLQGDGAGILIQIPIQTSVASAAS